MKYNIRALINAFEPVWLFQPAITQRVVNTGNIDRFTCVSFW